VSQKSLKKKTNQCTNVVLILDVINVNEYQVYGEIMFMKIWFQVPAYEAQNGDYIFESNAIAKYGKIKQC